MEHFEYRTKGTCASGISFDLDGRIIHNVRFERGCPGNLQAISKLVEGMEADRIVELLKGNICGYKDTSCADQLAIAVRGALEKSVSS